MGSHHCWAWQRRPSKDQGLHLQNCIYGQLLLPLIQNVAVLFVVHQPSVVLEQFPHQDMQKPVSPSFLALGQPALQAAVVALDCCICVLIGMREVAEGYDPMSCKHKIIYVEWLDSHHGKDIACN